MYHCCVVCLGVPNATFFQTVLPKTACLANDLCSNTIVSIKSRDKTFRRIGQFSTKTDRLFFDDVSSLSGKNRFLLQVSSPLVQAQN
ncbi:hypothetical protein E2986_11019 [Frieseomelitta varia]|uniref:Uncharacterized protein n=1 Tax=Frieseomelitta varia TaxID=561572 RepID=A0A833S2N7_9HYME|nr:hypothetical protein E2986_11019 [Frieseomelitta varia]